MRQEKQQRRDGKRQERRRGRRRRCDSLGGATGKLNGGPERLRAVVGVLHGRRDAAPLEHAHQRQLLLGLQGDTQNNVFHSPTEVDCHYRPVKIGNTQGTAYKEVLAFSNPKLKMSCSPFPLGANLGLMVRLQFKGNNC